MSKIEWTEKSWNPVTGCTKVSAGCDNCYAEVMARRLGSMNKNPLLANNGYPAPPDHFNVTLHEDRLLQPIRWAKPQRVFVCSMGDVFHPAVSDEFLDQVFGIMLACLIFENTPNHQFQLLTKRPERMNSYLTDSTPAELLKRWAHASPVHCDNEDVCFYELVESQTCADWGDDGRLKTGAAVTSKPYEFLDRVWPLPNVGLMMTAENQKTYDERWPYLAKCPAAWRGISAEPLLSPLNLEPSTLNLLHWVICGGESGPKARPMHPVWVGSLRDQCHAAGVPFFFKQWGEWSPLPPFHYHPTFNSGNREYNIALNRYKREHGASRLVDDRPEGWQPNWIAQGLGVTHGQMAIGRVGKKQAGRLLDGKLHDEYPVGKGEEAKVQGSRVTNQAPGCGDA